MKANRWSKILGALFLASLVACGGELTGSLEQSDATDKTGKIFYVGFTAAWPTDPEGQKQNGVNNVNKIKTSIENGGYPARFFVNESATEEWLGETMNSVAALAGKNDTVIIYAHTHGGDIGMRVLNTTWSAFRDMILPIQASNVLVFLHTCYSGQLVDTLDSQTDWKSHPYRQLAVFSAVGNSETASGSPTDNPVADQLLVHLSLSAQFSDFENFSAQVKSRYVAMGLERNPKQTSTQTDGCPAACRQLW